MLLNRESSSGHYYTFENWSAVIVVIVSENDRMMTVKT